MTELESVGPKKTKSSAKPASKKQRAFAKVVRLGAAAAVTVSALRRARQVPSLEAQLEKTRRKLARLMTHSLSPEQVAKMLETTAPSVVRRIRARSLYGVSYEGAWRVPRFQFDDGALLPGIDEVLPRLDSQLHPLEVINWFSLKNPDLVMRGKSVSPATWLKRGGDVESVAVLAAYVGSGL